ncbi:hypothetical protein [Rickettsiales endosymbiont of Stachyamoeba lipophora]|uniref:hypothetical protein n=1 Tax=Rickettsiales endosymbiont of Stachyamoeba lipophora TaxID=2486578 RepID=UPI000F6524A6|nr:hypothetical protein [Rickettsiales endosymbiont of Stachyamoeba lipophora]AZL15229.1 hypothetical protein EF513_01470 [Rickettsiales endosymbiont of Stachyamoeba lipophora]
MQNGIIVHNLGDIEYIAAQQHFNGLIVNAGYMSHALGPVLIDTLLKTAVNQYNVNIDYIACDVHNNIYYIEYLYKKGFNQFLITDLNANQQEMLNFAIKTYGIKILNKEQLDLYDFNFFEQTSFNNFIANHNTL